MSQTRFYFESGYSLPQFGDFLQLADFVLCPPERGHGGSLPSHAAILSRGIRSWRPVIYRFDYKQAFLSLATSFGSEFLRLSVQGSVPFENLHHCFRVEERERYLSRSVEYCRFYYKKKLFLIKKKIM